MTDIGFGYYKQDYFSTDFFALSEIVDYERERLMLLGVSVTDYVISVSMRDDDVIFYLHLYFRSNYNDVLTYKELFGNQKL